MTVTLGGISLDDNLQLQGLETAANISVSQVITLGGVSVATTLPLSGGRHLSLVALRKGDTIYGKYTIAQIEAIRTLAAAGSPVELVHHLGTFTVLIVSTEDISPAYGYADSQTEDWFTGGVELLEIG